MGAPAGQVQCMICHCHTGCECTKERWRTSSLVFSVYSKWMEAGGACSAFSSRVADSRVISGVFKNLFVFISRAVSAWQLPLIRGQTTMY